MTKNNFEIRRLFVLPPVSSYSYAIVKVGVEQDALYIPFNDKHIDKQYL